MTDKLEELAERLNDALTRLPAEDDLPGDEGIKRRVNLYPYRIETIVSVLREAVEIGREEKTKQMEARLRRYEAALKRIRLVDCECECAGWVDAAFAGEEKPA